MSLSLRAPAVGLSAAAVREGERAGQSVWRNLQTTKQIVLALAQAGGGITLGIIPVHLGVALHQECSLSRPFFCSGICARRRRKNFSPYVALQAWAGTPGVQLGEDSDRGVESSETGRRTGLLSCRNGKFVRESRGVGRTVERRIEKLHEHNKLARIYSGPELDKMVTDIELWITSIDF